MALLIRHYKVGDASGVSGLFARLHETDRTISPISQSVWERFASSESNAQGKDFFVAIDHAPVAIATSSRRDTGALVRHFRILVVKEFRRRGIGTSLLRRLVSLDKTESSKLTYQTLCPSEWCDAMAFYRQRGFIEFEKELEMTWNSILPAPRYFPEYPVEIVEKIAVSRIAKEIAHLHNVAYADDAAFVRISSAGMSKLLEDADAVLVARSNELLVGYCHLESDGKSIWIESVAVRPAHRHVGIGTALCMLALRYATARKMPVKLQVSSRNAVAVALYRSLGFELAHASVRFRAAGNELKL